jgi:hypothetical protein
LLITFNYAFYKSEANRLKINITSNILKTGKIKVSLGGNVKETIVIEVTNLILNKASITFRNIIANKISSAI